MKEQVVLSLFNGMNTLRQAMENVGIPVKKYYSSEIKPYAIKLTQHHFPDTIQLGDITKWREWDIDWSEITFIGSGSPCQDLSIAGKRAGIKGNKSSLFFTFIEILNHVKKLNPNVKFLQENVGSAPTEAIKLMSESLDILPIRINSNLVTAQNRDRFYWSNIKVRTDWTGYNWTDIPQPEDRKIFLKDIITDGAVFIEKAQALLESEAKTYSYNDMKKFTYLIKKRIEGGRQIPNFVYRNKGNTLLESDSRPTSNQDEILRRSIEMSMSNCVNDQGNIRILNKTELCRLQGFPDNYCEILSRNKSASLLGDGWTLPVIEHILSFYKN